MPAASGGVAAQRHARGGHNSDDHDCEIRPGRAQEVGKSDQRAREQRQALPRLLEHLHDLRHDEHQEAGDDADRHYRHQHGVEQRKAGLLLQRLARIEIIGKMLQHRRQRARFLAAVHQRLVEIGETPVVGAQGGG